MQSKFKCLSESETKPAFHDDETKTLTYWGSVVESPKSIVFQKDFVAPFERVEHYFDLLKLSCWSTAELWGVRQSNNPNLDFLFCRKYYFSFSVFSSHDKFA